VFADDDMLYALSVASLTVADGTIDVLGGFGTLACHPGRERG
jgi:hypothetical protein